MKLAMPSRCRVIEPCVRSRMAAPQRPERPRWCASRRRASGRALTARLGRWLLPDRAAVPRKPEAAPDVAHAIHPRLIHTDLRAPLPLGLRPDLVGGVE